MKKPEFLNEQASETAPRRRASKPSGRRKGTRATKTKTPGGANALPQALLAAASDPPGALSVQFELFDPLANHVCVAGSFNGWQPEALPLTKDPDGKWRATVCLPPGRHEYRFVVDRAWREDPMAEQAVANPFGGRNSVVAVIDRGSPAS